MMELYTRIPNLVLKTVNRTGTQIGFTQNRADLIYYNFLTIFSCPHITPQPGNQGKIIWLSGPPGAGKSTTCQLMARQNDYTYFEADCVFGFINPFTDVNKENPSIASAKNSPLKVVTPHATKFPIFS